MSRKDLSTIPPPEGGRLTPLAAGAVIGALFVAMGTVDVATVQRICGYRRVKYAAQALERISLGLPIYRVEDGVWAIVDTGPD